MTWKNAKWAVLDVETTGLNPTTDHIIEVGYCRMEAGEIVDSGSFLVEPPLDILPEIITKVTGLTIADLKGQQLFESHIPKLNELTQWADVYLAYNAPFDRGFFESEYLRAGQMLQPKEWLDPCVWVKQVDKYQKGKKLTEAAYRRGIKVWGAHRAQADAVMAAKVACTLLSALPDDIAGAVKLQDQWAKQQEADYAAWKLKQARTKTT